MGTLLKNAFPWMLAIASTLFAASQIRLNQIRGNVTPGATLLVSLLNGTVVQGTLAGLAVDGSGTVTLPPATATVPTTVITKLTAGQNTFPIPAGRTSCQVTLNGLVQAVSEDYAIQGSIISFLAPPSADSIVTLMCF